MDIVAPPCGERGLKFDVLFGTAEDGVPSLPLAGSVD